MKNTVIFLTFLISSIFSSNIFANICKDNKPNKITICHAGNDNNNPGKTNFVNICVDFAAVHGHLKNHDHDSVGPCGSTELVEGVAYACNAGIKHTAPSAQVCYQRTNPTNLCNPALSCPQGSNSPDCNCVCSGTNGGANVVDFMSYNGRTFTENSELDQIGDESFWDHSRYSRTSTTSQNSGYVQNGFVVATKSPENYVMKTGALSFNLGSEVYGTEYFVDMCWKNLNVDSKGEFDIKPTYGFKNKSFFGDTYVDSADIQSKTEVYCTDTSNSSSNVFSENYLPFPSQGTDLEPYVGSVDEVSFCRVRHYFKEANETFRPWKLNAIEVTTKLEVTLTGDQVVIDKGIRICHPISYEEEYVRRGKTETRTVEKVCQLRFETTDEYERFVLHHEDTSPGNSNSTYSVNHNDDYRIIEIGDSCGRSQDIAIADLCYESMDSHHKETAVKQAELTKALNLNFYN